MNRVAPTQIARAARPRPSMRKLIGKLSQHAAIIATLQAPDFRPEAQSQEPEARRFSSRSLCLRYPRVFV